MYYLRITGLIVYALGCLFACTCYAYLRTTTPGAPFTREDFFFCAVLWFSGYLAYRRLLEIRR